MPYYKVTITDIAGKAHTEIRKETTSDIDLVFACTKQQVLRERGTANILDIDVVMLRKGCKEVQQWLQQNANSTV